MTEEILQSAILRLRSKATEEFAIIKDLYHRPADKDTVDKIANHAIMLAQYESGVLALKQYSSALGMQTENEALSNKPEDPSTVKADENKDSSQPIGHEELIKRSKKYRDSIKDSGNNES
mgnify:CR=1 FL=1